MQRPEQRGFPQTPKEGEARVLGSAAIDGEFPIELPRNDDARMLLKVNGRYRTAYWEKLLQRSGQDGCVLYQSSAHELCCRTQPKNRQSGLFPVGNYLCPSVWNGVNRLIEMQRSSISQKFLMFLQPRPKAK